MYALNNDLVRQLNDGSDRRYGLLLALLVGLAICNAYLPSGYDWSVVSDSSDRSGGGSWAKRLQWVPLYLIALYVIWLRRALIPLLLPHVNVFLLLFTLWASLSAIWSYDPGVTIRRVIQIWGMLLIAFAFCLSSWHEQRLINVVRASYSLLLAMSLLFVVLLPQYGIHPGGDTHAGAWRGVNTHKNGMGNLAAVTMLLWVHAWAGRHAPWYRALPWIGLAGLFLITARSSTSLLIALGTSPVVWILCRPPVSSEGWLFRTVAVFLMLLLLPGYLFVLMYGVPTTADIIGPIAELVGKDVTLTGRSEIWDFMWAEIARHPVQGLGYGSFWISDETGPSAIIGRKLYFYPGQAHNGYLDIINETGIVGMALVALFLATHLFALGRAGFGRSEFAFHFAMFAVMLVWNVTESSLFRTVTNWLVISILSSLAVSRALSPLGRGWYQPPRLRAAVGLAA